ncbi:hypothetical protein [Microbacterium sp. YY-01]|uniref:VG15 protein n=1 Tax=Microbacterium sp. YY-01 TaxID=3421634 RepID=UPI003D17FC08
MTSLIRALLSIWFGFDWLWRPTMKNAAAAESAVQVDIAMARARRLARVFQLRQLALLDAEPDSLPDIVNAYERSGTPIVEVYKRPAWQVERELRKAIEKSVDNEIQNLAELPTQLPTDLQKKLEQRLSTIAHDDLAAAARAEAKQVLKASAKVIGYRRVIHPEFSVTGTCGLCVVASSRLYYKDELMPLHGNCKCTISPVTAKQDLGLKLNEEDLKRIYDAAGSTYAEDLKRIKVAVNTHGELGPILTRDGQHFRSVGDVNRDSKRRKFAGHKEMTKADDQRMWDAMRATSERELARLLKELAAGNKFLTQTIGQHDLRIDVESAIASHRRIIARAIARGA